MPRKILILIGPTASGKSDLAIKKAQELDAEIISADAFQVYKGMDIGTAKLKDFQNITHHLIDIKNPNEPYTVTEFIEKTQDILNQNPQKNYIITGGTALYLHALIYNYNFPKESASEFYVQTLEEQAKKDGSEKLWYDLHQKDPDLAQTIPKTNLRRIIRSLSILHQAPKTIEKLRSKSTQPDPKYTLIGITRDRNLLIQRINQRVDEMIQEGLIEEVEGLLKVYPKTLNAFQAIGYKECIVYLEGGYTKEEMIEKIKIKTRQFAKRQMTWFRRFEGTTWI